MLPETTWIVVLVLFLGKEHPEPAPEPIPKPTPKKRVVLILSPEDMQEAKKSMKKGY